MDHVTQVRPDIHGSYSGNSGKSNMIGSNNTIKITNMLPDMTNFGAGNRGDTSEVGDGVHNRIAPHGLGGSGKTQIALEYVYQCASFREIGQRIRIPLARAAVEEVELLRSIRRWFEGPNSGDRILVIDNADNDADFVGINSPIAKFIPQGARGTVIFTTRSRLVASRQGCKMIEVGKMEEEDAQELFSKRVGSGYIFGEGEKKAIRMILASLHHLPLAIIGAAAFMTETETSPSAYWTILRESDVQAKRLLSQEFCDIQREVDEPESILGTYFTTFNRISQQMPRAMQLLRLISCLDRHNIPEELLRQSGLEEMDDSVEFRRVIGKLLGFSLLAIVKGEEKTFYELHRLVQLSLQVYLPTKELKQARVAALKMVSRLFPQEESEQRSVGPIYIQHALVVSKDSTGRIAEELCFRMGQYFQAKGSNENAEIQFRRCIALRGKGKDYEWDNEGQGSFRLPGGEAQIGGGTNMMVKIFQNLLGIPTRPMSQSCADMLKHMNILAVVLKDRGKYDESETMHRRALESQEKLLGPDDPDTLTSTNNLAAVPQAQGKYDESETMHRRALESREKILGPDHPATLTSTNNLAAVLRAQGKYDESEALHRREWGWSKKILGPDHPSTLTSTNNLALVLGTQGKYDESEILHRRTLESREKILGPDHPATLTSTNNLAAVLRAQGKYDESETLHRRTLERREKILGPDHPSTLNSTNNLALVLGAQGKYDESETLHRRTLERREKILGPDHPSTLNSLSNLALVLQDQGKYDESETLHRRELERSDKILVPDHPPTLISTNNLALVLGAQRKYN
ncbi:TPR-like protein [Tuber magnatum]|uniref:TPR-like protein n=1 Tax=Tuber magnatum TaxID=42249 RepID=A0A317SN55_9PEZI|nr:TPR-like protein [Tuber magnatum]